MEVARGDRRKDRDGDDRHTDRDDSRHHQKDHSRDNHRDSHEDIHDNNQADNRGAEGGQSHHDSRLRKRPSEGSQRNACHTPSVISQVSPITHPERIRI